MGLPALSSRGLLPTNLPLFSRRLQLAIPLGMNLLLTAGEHVVRRDVADGAVQADVVVILDVSPLPDTARLPATGAFPAGCTLL